MENETMPRSENEEFEYNDGLGDMLREKDKYEFSWTKTIILLLAIVIIILIFFILSFNLGKKILVKKADLAQISELNKIRTEPKSLTITSTGELTEIPSQKELMPINNSKTTGIKVLQEKSIKNIEQKKTKKNKKVISIGASNKQKNKESQNIQLKYKVIVGSFNNRANANIFAKKLKIKGISSFIWVFEAGGHKYYRVQAGAYETYKDALNKTKKLKTKGVSSYVLKK